MRPTPRADAQIFKKANELRNGRIELIGLGRRVSEGATCIIGIRTY